MCKSKRSNIKLAVQDLKLRGDLYLLPLGDYKVFLGIEWLRNLGDVLWNFSKLTMKFTLNRKRVIVQGKRGNNTTIASSHRMEHILKKTCKASLVPNLEGKVAFKGGGRIGFSRTFSKSFPWSLR
jgi:hypothetical protein